MPEGDLLTVYLPVRPFRSGVAPAHLGGKWEAWLLDRVRPYDAVLSQALHDLPRRPAGVAAQASVPRRKPFAVAPLLDRPVDTVNAGQEIALVRAAVVAGRSRPYWLRVSMVDTWLPALAPPGHDPPVEWLTDLWRVIVEPPAGGRISLRGDGPSEWDFERAPEPVEEQRASFSDLLYPPWPERWQIDFVTPTTFKGSDNRFVAHPDVRRLLASLGRAWADLAPAELAGHVTRPLVATLAGVVVVEQMTHRPESAELSTKERYPAFIGRLTLRCPTNGPAGSDWRPRLLAALLRLAPFTGAGYMTPRGLGSVRTRPL